MKKIIATAAIALASLSTLSACSTDADTASRNLSQAAENFEVQRRITFYNGITDAIALEVEGRCSVETSDSGLKGSLEVTCKIGPDQYKKHFLGLSDNMTYVVEQLDPIDVSTYYHRVIFKPQSIVPDIDVKGGSDDGE